MIQVCSQCGTRWNVRDRRRVWCPRCNGTLLAPSGPESGAEWSARPSAPAAAASFSYEGQPAGAIAFLSDPANTPGSDSGRTTFRNDSEMKNVPMIIPTRIPASASGTMG